MSSTTSSSFSSSSSVPTPTPTPTPGAAAGNPNGNNSSKSLLFFVALGFGVVFANLWIIVGVKYCFRYNARNRARQAGEDVADPIDLAAMPRPRRRREKKLMSMDEVNERFPLTKYKTWRAARQQEGLPAAGGVEAPASRAASIKETMQERMSDEAAAAEGEAAEPSSPKSPLRERAPALGDEVDPQREPQTEAADVAPATGIADAADATTHSSSQEPHASETATTVDGGDAEKFGLADAEGKSAAMDKEALAGPSTPKDDDDDDPIQHATTHAHDDLLQNPGDACAICIDNLDDDDDVRGLTCGHAFHAGCLDPWLTNRRACCPLCKADYYVPKMREPAAATAGEASQAEAGAAVLAGGAAAAAVAPQTEASRPAPTGWMAARAGRGRFVAGQRFGFPVLRNASPAAAAASAPRAPPQPAVLRTSAHTGGIESMWSAAPVRGFARDVGSVFRTRNRGAAAAPAAAPEAAGSTAAPAADQRTPSQLEAGVAP